MPIIGTLKESLRLRWLMSVCGLCLAVAGTAAPGGKNTFDGAYSGKRTLVQGSDTTCPKEENVSVVINGETLTFTNKELKKFTITFYPDPNGSFGETYVDEGGATVVIHGMVTDNAIDADVKNPPCEHHWHLKRD